MIDTKWYNISMDSHQVTKLHCFVEKALEVSSVQLNVFCIGFLSNQMCGTHYFVLSHK